MTAGLDDQAFDQLLLCAVALSLLLAIVVIAWPLDERPSGRGLLRRWRR